MDIPEEEKNKIAQILLSEKYSAEHNTVPFGVEA